MTNDPRKTDNQQEPIKDKPARDPGEMLKVKFDPDNYDPTLDPDNPEFDNEKFKQTFAQAREAIKEALDKQEEFAAAIVEQMNTNPVLQSYLQAAAKLQESIAEELKKQLPGIDLSIDSINVDGIIMPAKDLIKQLATYNLEVPPELRNILNETADAARRESAIIEEVKELEPYIQKELKKKKYGGRDLDTLWDEAETTNGGSFGSPAPSSLFSQAIKAARIAKARDKASYEAKAVPQLFDKQYLSLYNGTASNELLMLAVKQIKYKGDYIQQTPAGNIITIEKFEELQTAWSTFTRKVLDASLIYLADANFYRDKNDNIVITVKLPLKEFGEVCGQNFTPATTETPEERRKESERIKDRLKHFKEQLRKSLHDISCTTWTGEETRGTNKGDYKEMRIISSHSIQKGIITINFDVEAARYFINSHIMTYPTALFKIDNRDSNSYMIGRKLAMQNGMNNNIISGTNTAIKVKTLLEATPDIISYEALTKGDNRNWKQKIKLPLERALNKNKEIGVIEKWEYRDTKTGRKYSAAQVDNFTWDQYNKLTIDFIMNLSEDQKERQREIIKQSMQRQEEKPVKKSPGRPRKKE